MYISGYNTCKDGNSGKDTIPASNYCREENKNDGLHDWCDRISIHDRKVRAMAVVWTKIVGKWRKPLWTEIKKHW